MVKYWDAYIIKTLANPLLIDYNMSISFLFLNVYGVSSPFISKGDSGLFLYPKTEGMKAFI